jgi:hypothetical protein
MRILQVPESRQDHGRIEDINLKQELFGFYLTCINKVMCPTSG